MVSDHGLEYSLERTIINYYNPINRDQIEALATFLVLALPFPVTFGTENLG